MTKILVILAIISCTTIAIAWGQGDMAAGLAGRAISSDSSHRVGQPVFGGQGGGGGNNGRNWAAGGTVGIGTKVWESRNGRHAIGAGAAASQSFGRHQGQSWHSRPSYGVGAGYRYTFGGRGK